MKLDKILAFVSNGSKGIGRKFASDLLSRGARVVIADVDKKSGMDLEDKMSAQYGEKRLKFMECDTSNIDELHKTFEYTKEYLGGLNLVCNNANITSSDVIKVSKQIATNLTAPIEGTYKGIELMSIQNGGNGGTVINITSSSGYNIMNHCSVYSATKFGIVGFSRSFKFLEYGCEQGVRVNCVCPFLLDPDKLKESIIRSSGNTFPLSHFGYADMDDVSKALMMCVEDENLNGEVLAAHAPPYVIKFFD